MTGTATSHPGTGRAGLPAGKATPENQAKDIAHRFRAVMAAYVDDADRVDLSRPFHALGMDSIDVLDLTMDVEDEFHIPIPDHTEQGWNNPAEALAWLTAQSAAPACGMERQEDAAPACGMERPEQSETERTAA